MSNIPNRVSETVSKPFVLFWVFWVTIGLIVELWAAFGRSERGDTFSESWWKLWEHVKGHGTEGFTWRGFGAMGLSLIPLIGLGWAALHLSTGLV